MGEPSSSFYHSSGNGKNGDQVPQYLRNGLGEIGEESFAETSASRPFILVESWFILALKETVPAGGDVSKSWGGLQSQPAFFKWDYKR